MASSSSSSSSSDLAEFCEFVIASLFEIAPQASASTPNTGSGNTAGTSAPSSTSTLQQTYGREGIDTPPYTPPLDGNPARNSKEPPALLEFIVSTFISLYCILSFLFCFYRLGQLNGWPFRSPRRLPTVQCQVPP